MALSALQYSLLKLSLRAFSSANRYTVANLSESDLLGFWNQLASDSASASALPAVQDAAVDRTVRAMLCANNSFVALPDADWASFFTQLSTDATGASSLPAAQYSALKLQLRALISGYSATPFNLSESDLLGYLKPRVNSFAGDFGALFAGYGLNVRSYFRGDLGVSGASGTGKAVWTNQRGDGSSMAPGGAATNGIGSADVLNGKAVIATDGSTQSGAHTFPSGAAPGTTNRHRYAVQVMTAVGTGYVLEGGFNVIKGGATADQQISNAVGGATTSGEALNQWHRMRASWIGGLDVIRVGSHEPTPTSTSNNGAATSWGFAANNGGFSPVAMKCAMFLDIEGPIATFLTAAADADAKLAAFWPGATSIEI